MPIDLPPTYEHPVLGTLTWNEGELAYMGELSFEGRPLSIEIVVDEGAWDEPMSLAFLIDQGATAVSMIRQTWSGLYEVIGSSLLREYDETWRADGAALTGPALMAHLKPLSVTIYADGRSSVFFADNGIDEGGLFAGHYVLTALTREGRVEDVSLAG